MREHHDRIGETSTTTGTVPFVLAGAIDNHRTFGSVTADGEKRVYHADDDGGNWEVGLGTFDESANTCRAATNADVWASSNGGNLVDFPTGTKHIVHGQSAEEVPFVRSPGDPRWHVPEAVGVTGQALIKSGDQQLGWGDFATLAQFEDHIGNLDIHRVMDDTVTSETTLWSSDKIAAEIEAGVGGGGDLDDAVILAPETSTRNVITPAAVDVVPMTVGHVAGQSVDRQRWLDGDGEIIGRVTPAGSFRVDHDGDGPYGFADIRSGGQAMRMVSGNNAATLLFANTGSQGRLSIRVASPAEVASGGAGAGTEIANFTRFGQLGLGVFGAAVDRTLHVRASDAAFRIDRQDSNHGPALILARMQSGTVQASWLFGSFRMDGAQVDDFGIWDYGANISGTAGAPRLTINRSTGNVGVGMAVATSRLTVDGDTEVLDGGLILHSPDESRWRVTIDDSGNLQTASL